jgi:putative transposase
MPWKEMDAMNLRTEFVMRAFKEENFRALCQEYGISPKTGYKWLERFKRHGLSGLEEASRRPHGHARELSEEVICEIVRLKKSRPAWGPKKIRAVYARAHEVVPSESTFKRVLDKAGWVEHRRLRRRESAGRIFQGRKAEKPNDVWTVDFKGWWYGSNRQRCEPLTVRDEFSRYVLEVRAVANARTETIRDCFEQLFQQHGLPAAIRSDNGAPFASCNGVLGLSRLSVWWLVLGIDLERGRPGCPQDNPAHERFHRDVAQEVEAHPCGSQQSVLDQWRHDYNHERPHEAIGMRCPAELFSASDRAYTCTPEDLEYPCMTSRRVAPCGTISWRGQWVGISQAVAGWSVGLEPAAGGQWKVWFGRLQLGQLDDASFTFNPAGKDQPE